MSTQKLTNNPTTNFWINSALDLGAKIAEAAVIDGPDFDFEQNFQAALKFQDPDFLKAGEEKGIWFSVSENARRAARNCGKPEAPMVLAKIEGLMGFVNGFLARDDLTDAEKKEFLSRFLTSANDKDYDDEDIGTVAQLFAAVMTGDDGTLYTLFQELTHDDMLAIETKFNEEFGKWARDQRGMDLRQGGNHKARQLLKEISENAQRTSKNIENKTVAELAEEPQETPLQEYNRQQKTRV